MRIFNDLINFRYRKNDYNTGVQLQIASFEKLYPIVYFDLRNVEKSFSNEQEFTLKQIGNELVTV